MQSLQKLISQTLAHKIPADAASAVQATREERFGDYQCTAAMAVAKKEGKNPRQVAEQWLQQLTPELKGIATVDIAGPGFLNLKLEDAWVAAQLQDWDPTRWHTGRAPQKTVVDYSSPNVAKEMHVGHIRSTIIGDTIVRILEFAGDHVIRQNHIGDWGTQFGMLCAHLKEHPEAAQTALSSIEDLYRDAHARFKADPEFEARARATVVALHHGDPETLKLWAQIVEISRQHFQPLYQRLGVLLQPSDECGESFYRDRLAPVVEELIERFPEPEGGIQVRISDGAVCVFHFDEKGEPLFLTRDKTPEPFIVRKSDGAYLYASTDLAACKYRVQELGAERIIVITDARQAGHFKMLLATVKACGWLAPADRAPVPFEHVTFGTILGDDRKPLKTRSGGTVKLSELLDEAVERSADFVMAQEAIPEKSRNFNPKEIMEITEAVGIGSIKYCDLSQNRSSDYLFSWEKLLSLEGNTAPYLMFAYARLRAIIRRGEVPSEEVVKSQISLGEPAERALALTLLRFAETLDNAEQDWKINLLAEYLYGLASLVMRFLEQCPVLKADNAELRLSRLKLCHLTSLVLAQGLSLLGIKVVERM